MLGDVAREMGQLAGQIDQVRPRRRIDPPGVFGHVAKLVGQPLNPDNKNIVAWMERVKARTPAKAPA